jgi:dolichyl-phosphate-mannose-protein mannosyltransferase
VATEHLWWELVVLPHQAGGSDAAAAALKHRSVTLLRHVATGTFLSASIGESGTQLKVVAPLPALQQWNNVTELAEAMWRIEILGGDDVVLRTPSSLVRLSHVNTSRALQCTNDVVDSDGTSDLVFPCIAGANIHDTTGGWHFDRAQIQANNGGTDGQSGASAAAAMTSTMSSMAKIIELHSVIFKRNNEMSGEHTFGSRPPDWPLMHRGIIFWHGSAHGVPTKGCTAQVYFLGNPAVWWAAATAVPLYVLFDVMYTVRIKRDIHDLPMSQVSTLMQSGRLLIAAWIIHFVPFFFFDRLLFLHHYLPALVFSIMVAGVMLEHIWVQWTPAGIASHVALVWLAVIAGCFICFTPFNFATGLCGDGLEQRQWRASWDLHGLDAADPSATVT